MEKTQLEIVLKNNTDLLEALIDFLEEFQETPRLKMLRPGISAEDMLHENMVYNTVESIKNKITELADMATLK